jgi:hypothetical protein
LQKSPKIAIKTTTPSKDAGSQGPEIGSSVVTIGVIGADEAADGFPANTNQVIREVLRQRADPQQAE